MAAGALVAPLLAPLRAMAEEAGRTEFSAVAAAEAEKPALLAAPRAVDMPILVYHHVVPGRSPSLLFENPDSFEQELKYLKDNGYQPVSFDDLADCLEHGVALPERPVILSFDDGWDNQFNHAFPLLQKYSFTATFFAVTGYVDHENFMTTEQLKTLLAAGMTIGSHTRTHPALAGVGGGQRLREEVAGSKAWLEDRLEIAVSTFAYPYGSYSASVVAAVKAAGYRTARTVDIGTHYTPADLATLAGVVFPAYLRHYRGTVELAAAGPR